MQLAGLLAKDTTLCLTRYQPLGVEPAWYLNHDRTTNKGRVSTKFCHWLLGESILQEAGKEGNKTAFTLTSKILMIPDPEEDATTPEPEEPELKREVVHVPKTTVSEDESGKGVVYVTNALTPREQIIRDALKTLTDDEVKQALFFGIEMLKDDLKKEMLKKEERLNHMQEALKCLG